MDNRPFYELDDDEILIEEAANAALSDAVTPLATTASVTPALPLCAPLNPEQATALLERLSHKQTLTLLDHAYLLNRLACTLTLEKQDAFGFAAALREESALLLLDAERCKTDSRSSLATFPDAGIARFMQSDLDYRGRMPRGLSIRLERDALTHFTATFANSTPFFTFRRFTLALMPTLTKEPTLTDILEKYTVSARILINTAAAKQAIMPWERLAFLSDAEAERDARKVFEVLHESMGALDT